MTCNIMTPFLPLSISMLVPTLCDCFSSSTFPDDSGNLQSRTKALGTLLQKVLGRFPIPTPFPHHPSSLHKKRCTHISRSFLRVSALYRVGGGRTARNFRKGCTVLRGNREMTEKHGYCSTVPRTFVQDCLNAGFGRKKVCSLHFSYSF